MARVSVLSLLCLAAPAVAFAGEGVQVEVGGGFSETIVGKTKVTTRTDFFVTGVKDHVTDHDGFVPGGRIQGAVSAPLPWTVSSYGTSVALKGFYGSYSGTQRSRCYFSATQDCAFVPLYDPSPATVDIAGGFLSRWNTVTKKDVEHFGGAVELRFEKGAVVSAGGLKDAPVVEPSGFQWRVGAGVRRFDQNTRLYSVDTGPTEDPVHLGEKLATDYYGGYLGFTIRQPLPAGFRVAFSGDGGAYVGDTKYGGRFSASALLGSGLPIAQTLSLSSQEPAFISSLGLTLERDIGPVTVGVFGEGEWISNVPTLKYNDWDRASTTLTTLQGTQDGTKIGSTSALTYTAGLKVTVPFK
jgi:hypothetical protein